MAITKEQLKHVLYAARAHTRLAHLHFGAPKTPATATHVDLALLVSAAWEAGASAERLGTYFRGPSRLPALVRGAAEYLAEPDDQEPLAVMGSPVFYACSLPCCTAGGRARARA